MELVTLGMTDLKVSPIAFGAWELGGEWGSFDEDEAIAAIRHARDRGVNLFDTAQAYGFGVSERLLGRALREDLDHSRGEIVVATKGGLRLTDRGLVRDSSPAWLRQGVDASLEALGVDFIDLYQVHWPDSTVDFAESAGALDELVRAGKIGHVGVSNFGVAEMTAFAERRPVETLQPPYSLFRREIEGEVLPFTATQDIGVLVYGPMAHGLLTGHLDKESTFAPDDWRSASPSFRGDGYERNLETVSKLQQFAADELDCSVAQLAVAWTLANPAVQVAIVGARRPRHIDDAIEAAEIRLGPSELGAINRIMSGAVPFTGPAPEMMPEQ